MTHQHVLNIAHMPPDTYSILTWNPNSIDSNIIFAFFIHADTVYLHVMFDVNLYIGPTSCHIERFNFVTGDVDTSA